MAEKHITIEHVINGVPTKLYPDTKVEYVEGLSSMIPTVPTNVSAFTNDAGYLTEEQYQGTYSKPTDGIPKTDLDSAVQTSLDRADTALQSSDITDKEDTSNKVASWSDTTDNTHYPTEKLVKDSLDGKAESVHTHTKSDISDFPTSLPASNTVDTYSSSGTAPVSGKAVSEALNTLGTAASKGVSTLVTDSGDLVTASAVKTYVDTVSAKASNYLGTVSALTGLSTSATKGDFYRASVAFGSAHVGDIIIAEKSSPSQAIDNTNWSLLHNETNTDTSVTSVNNHYIPSKSTTKSASGGDLTDITNSSSGTQVVTGVEMDAAGHVTGVTSVALKSVNTNTEYSVATTSANGLMSSSDKTKLNGIATNANNYTLPAATSSTRGGVVVGSNITVSSGTISLTKANVTSALGYTPPTTNTTYSSVTASSGSTATGLCTGGEKYTWNNKYTKPSSGIPKSDLASDVQSVINNLSGVSIRIVN